MINHIKEIRFELNALTSKQHCNRAHQREPEIRFESNALASKLHCNRAHQAEPSDNLPADNLNL